MRGFARLVAPRAGENRANRGRTRLAVCGDAGSHHRRAHCTVGKNPSATRATTFPDRTERCAALYLQALGRTMLVPSDVTDP